MKYKVMDEKGRSMIEMLGVLAIVGVLSVAGIAGYSKAMAKYKINKSLDQISTLAANTKTLFASVGNYGGLSANSVDSNIMAYKLGLFPEDMIKGCANAAAASTAAEGGSCVRNGLNGKVTIAPQAVTNAGDSFYIKFEGLTKDACTALFTSDWGGASGFRGVRGNKKGTDCSGTKVGNVEVCTPANLTSKGVYSLAKVSCDAATDKGYEIVVLFY